MKKAIVFLLGIIMIISAFIIFNPNRYIEIFSFEPLKNMVREQVRYHGLKKVVFIFSVLAPLEEELVYRSPVWLFCFIAFLLKVRGEWQRVIALLILFIATMLWAIPHGYPAFYQGCVFLGGITSGLFTIYLMDRKIAKIPGWLITLFLPILLHGLFNFGFILIVWKFLL